MGLHINNRQQFKMGIIVIEFREEWTRNPEVMLSSRNKVGDPGQVLSSFLWLVVIALGHAHLDQERPPRRPVHPCAQPRTPRSGVFPGTDWVWHIPGGTKLNQRLAASLLGTFSACVPPRGTVGCSVTFNKCASSFCTKVVRFCLQHTW